LTASRKRHDLVEAVVDGDPDAAVAGPAELGGRHGRPAGEATIVSVRRVRPPSVEKLTTTSSGSPSASAAFQRIATLPAEPSVVPGLGLSSFTVGG
jgi:hypothetical protein